MITMRITRRQLRQLITESFAGSQFFDDEGRTFSVESVVAFAQENHDKYFIPQFPLDAISHDLEYWQGDEERMMRADVSYPLLVIIEDGCLSVADGLNRMYKAVNVLGMTHIDVYLVPKEDIMMFGT
jgi:hypothetical protein